MTDWRADVVARYGAVAAGIAIGTAAKYGLQLNEGRAFTWRGVAADVLLLAFLGIVAIVASDQLALTGNAKVLAGSLAAVSSDRLVRLVRSGFLQWAAAKLGAVSKALTEKP